MFDLATVAYLALLITSGQASTCSISNGMTEELRKVFVDQHNEYRSLVAKGLAPNPVAGGNAPKAARMFKMAYDCSIEDKMVTWLQQCTWGHSPKTERKGLGENLWMVSPVDRNKTDSVIRAVTDWFAELKEKGVPTANQFTSAVFSRGVGHYTQVVWEKSDRIGCAIRDCSSMTYVGCEYKPGGNMLNDYIYEVGDPCTKNEDCKCDNCTCSTNEALCIRPDSTPMPDDQVNSQTQQGTQNGFTLPHDFMNSRNLMGGFMNTRNLLDGWSSQPLSFSWKGSQDQQQGNDFFSKLGSSWKSSQNQQHENEVFSKPQGFNLINSRSQQHGDDLFSKMLGSTRMSSQKQQGKHEWTTGPHGNGFKWSYSWSS